MPAYSYKVKSESGRVLVGEYKAESRFELEKLLIDKGYTPIEIKEKNIFTDVGQLSFLKPKVKTKDLAIFCRQFAVIIEAGVPIVTAMDVLREQTSNKTMKECLDDIYESIQKGISLSSSMKQHPEFPDLLVSMVEAGELSGQLDRIFVRMADHFEKEVAFESKVRSALTYPIIVLVVAALVIFILMWKVVPTFSDVLKSMNAELPLVTKILIGIGDFFKKWWWLLILVIAGIVVASARFKKSITGKRFFSNIAIKAPVIKGVTKIIATARLTRTLSTMISSGIHLVHALESVQKVLGNTFVIEKMNIVTEEIKRGKTLAQSIKAMAYFPPMLTSMVKIGEESGNIDYTLEKCADFYDQEMEVAMEKLTAFLGPAIILVLGVIVAFIVISILVPMLTIYSSVLQG